MKHSLAALLSACLLGVSPFVSAEKIYKWVDSEGNVHYGSEPGSKKAEEMRIHTTPAAAPAPAAQPAGEPQPSFIESFDKEQQEKAEAAAKAAKENEVRAKNCDIVRKRLTNLELGGRIYEIDNKGERSYLGDEEIQKRLQQAKEDVAKWCQ
jgi:hypothetical protein